MNESSNINPATCQMCAKCCLHFNIGYPKSYIWSKELKDQLFFSEVQRFLDLEMEDVTVEEYSDEFAVTFNKPCKHLLSKNGKYYCDKYEEGRPLLCAHYPYEKNKCEKYETVINVFTKSEEFLERIEQIKKEAKP